MGNRSSDFGSSIFYSRCTLESVQAMKSLAFWLTWTAAGLGLSIAESVAWHTAWPIVGAVIAFGIGMLVAKAFKR